MQTTRKINVALVGGLALLMLIALTALYAHERLVRDVQSLTHTYDVRAGLRSFDAQLREAKSNVRSVLITGDSSYVVRYRASVDTAQATFATLQRLTLDNPEQHERLRALRPLLDRRVQSFDRTLALRSTSVPSLTTQPEAERRLAAQLNEGEILSNRIGLAVSAIDSVETALLAQRAAAERTSEQIVRLLLLAFAIGGAGLALLMRRSIGRDLRDRAAVEQALRESEAKFSGILSIAADAIITVDAQQTIRHFNDGAEQIFGYRRSEILGQSLDLLLPAQIASVHRAHISAFASAPEMARRMGERRHVLGKRKTGEEFPAEASISKVPTSGGLLFTVVLRDVSDQKRRERYEHVLAEGGRKLMATIDYDALLRIVAELPVPDIGDWCILDTVEARDNEDPTFRRLASRGLAAEHDIALRALEAHDLNVDSPSRVLDVLRTRKPEIIATVDAEWLEAHTDPDELRSVSVLGVRSMLLVPLAVGERVIGAMTIGAGEGRRLFDAYDLGLAQALADRATLAIENARNHSSARRAIAVRDEVLSVVSHDLRNPLSAVSMCARTLLDHPPADADGRRKLYQSTLDATDWMQRMMQDLLDAASIDAGRLSVAQEPHVVQQLLEASVHMLSSRAAAEAIALEIDIDPRTPLVHADASRVLQVFSNLLANAIKYSSRLGTVTIGAAPRDGEVIFWVRDNGSGISPEHLPHIFDRFWHLRGASRARGTGLGLAIARGIVAAHGGRIWVESEVGVGSSFFFTLPVATSAISDSGATYGSGAKRTAATSAASTTRA